MAEMRRTAKDLEPRGTVPRGRVAMKRAAFLASSEIRPDDVENAASTFRRDAPREFRRLLDAEPDDQTPDTPAPEAR